MACHWKEHHHHRLNTGFYPFAPNPVSSPLLESIILIIWLLGPVDDTVAITAKPAMRWMSLFEPGSVPPLTKPKMLYRACTSKETPKRALLYTLQQLPLVQLILLCDPIAFSLYTLSPEIEPRDLYSTVRTFFSKILLYLVFYKIYN